MALRAHSAFLIAKHWQIIKQTDIEGEIGVSDILLFPDFSFEHCPFILELGKSTYNVVNVKTGNRSVLIAASAQNDLRQFGVRVMGLENGRISIDFNISQLNEIKGEEQQWFNVSYTEDFLNILKQFGRLPAMTIEETM